MNNLQLKAVIIGIITNKTQQDKVNEYLDELAFLLKTLNISEIKRFTQKLEKQDPKTFIGKGKILEIKEFIEQNKIDIAAFDDELSPSQIRNISKILQCKIIDRSDLILEIFAYRAKTNYAKIQVKLAQYQYILPRLTRMWTHLSKQRGGIGLRGGPGETEIETDRRIIKNKITNLKKQLKEIDKQKETQRKNRQNIVRVSLVGYTNVGKSTIMNLLSKSNVFVENKLFATLDTTTRKIFIHDKPILLSDTVGFIRKLPHTLIESFKSTLDEIREADIIIHVVDISNPNFEEYIDVVKQTLTQINVIDKPTITVFNKIDQYSYIEKDKYDLTPFTKENYTLDMLINSWMSKVNNPTVFISATKKINIDSLRNTIYQEVSKIYQHWQQKITIK